MSTGENQWKKPASQPPPLWFLASLSNLYSAILFFTSANWYLSFSCYFPCNVFPPYHILQWSTHKNPFSRTFADYTLSLSLSSHKMRWFKNSSGPSSFSSKLRGTWISFIQGPGRLIFPWHHLATDCGRFLAIICVWRTCTFKDKKDLPFQLVPSREML